jgi:hypothetical protein
MSYVLCLFVNSQQWTIHRAPQVLLGYAFIRPSSQAGANLSQRLKDNVCLHDELHEYDQYEDSSKISGPDVLLSHDVFAFRKVLVAVERFGGLFQRTGDWLFLAGCFCLEGWLNAVVYQSVNHTPFFPD